LLQVIFVKSDCSYCQKIQQVFGEIAKSIAFLGKF